jgi:hypothetical protein|tara:strand:+ start:105 stop:392 length:288 start_codon:yes stop_codon:yes gene_type:complete
MEKNSPQKIRTRDFQIGGVIVELKASINKGYTNPSVIAFTPEISIRCVHCDIPSAVEKFAQAIVAAIESQPADEGHEGRVAKTREVIYKLIEDTK